MLAGKPVNSAGFGVIRSFFLGSASEGIAQLAEHALKILGFAEIAIHARIADVSDAVDGLQTFHDKAANVLRANLGIVAVFELAHDGADELLDALLADLALPEGDADRAGELVPVEGDAPPVPLHDNQLAKLDPLESREPRTALRAAPAPADRGVIL